MHQTGRDAGGSSPAAEEPTMNTSRRLAGLEAPVEIHRDAWGIAHIRARHSQDAWFGLGYVHASDRMWQMDATRRRMAGRWSEWVGADGVAADQLCRRLGGEAASRRDLAALGGEARAMLSAYTAGVNAWLGEGHQLPLEYRLLDTRPEPWEDWHAIAAMRYRGFLMGSVWFKLWRAAALGAIGPEAIATLRYHDGGKDLLTIPPGAESERWMASLQDLAPAISALAELSAADATGGGSNNWAVAGSRTASGRPLLAGDPHRAFEMPGMYLQTHVASDRFDVIGLTVPGVPGFPHFAHNGKVAWCVTHAFADIHDLFVENFDDQGRHLTPEGWKPSRIREEQILVRDGPPVTVCIVETGHGPVIAGDPGSGYALTLQSVQFAVTDRSFDCLPAMLQAKSVDELFAASRGWGLIDHNLVAADTAGHIGHLVRAIVPDRPRLNGWLPVPGWTGDYDWRGMIPWEDMPVTTDPARGFLVTANNRFVAEAPGDRYYFCTDCHPPWRAQRIEGRLAAMPAATVDDMTALHLDDVSLAAPIFQAGLAQLPGAALAGLRPPARRRHQELLAWDGRMNSDSTGAACYSRWRWALATVVHERSGLAATSSNPLMRLPPGVIASHQLWWTLPQLVLNDDCRLLGGLTWPAAFAAALERIGEDDAKWGALHQVAFAHPLAARYPEAAGLLQPPGAAVGGDNDTIWANGCLPGNAPAGTGGWHAPQAFKAAYGAVARYVFDVGNWEASGWIVFDGVAGDPESPHYVDQHPLWASGRLIPMHYDWQVITAGNRCLTLAPVPGRPQRRSLSEVDS
jgi:penicillin amidase